MGSISARGLEVPVAALAARLGGARAYGRLLRALTVVERPQPGRPRVYARARRRAFCVEGGRLRLSRAKAAPLLACGALSAVRAEPALAAAWRPGAAGGVRAIPPARWRPAQPFYAYQLAAADHLFAPGGALARPGLAYVAMETGLGKTRLALAVAARAGGPVFVVVPTKAIREQWLDEFRAVFPALSAAPYANPPKGSRRRPPEAASHDAVVGLFNTVRAKAPGFFAGYATVVLDEAHELHSPKNLAILWLAQGAPRVLGLTATPAERADGLDRVVGHFLGAPLGAEADIPGFDVAGVAFSGRVREVDYAGPPEHTETVLSAAGTVSAIETIGRIVEDPARLRLVAAEVERLWRLHETEPPAGLRALGLGPRPPEAATPEHPAGGLRAHGIFVFAELRAYLPALRRALLERFAPEELAVPELGEGGAGGVEGGGALSPVVLRGGASRADLCAARRARIVLTTYGYSRRGISLVGMTAMVLATPRRHGLRQILGRIIRRGSDESIVRLVVDIKDVRTALKGQSSSRRSVYKAKGYPIYRVRRGHPAYAPPAEARAPPTSEEELVWAPPPPG